MCVISKKQYIDSGLEHCKNDLEISLTDVIRLQKYVNANVDWLNDIFGTGEFWGHEDRVKASSIDLGAQAAPLRLLLKDHKPYDLSSGLPVPSRPVVNGKSGYNCHLSELLSMILGPISRETPGNEINSTGDLLSRIEKLNINFAENQAGQISPTAKQSSEGVFCDHCSKCNGPEPSLGEKLAAKNHVERVSNKSVRTAMHVSNNLRAKLLASRSATKLYHRCCVDSEKNQDPQDDSSSQEDDEDFHTKSLIGESSFSSFSDPVQSNSPSKVAKAAENLQNLQNDQFDHKINMDGPIMVTGFDVKSLYPSLRDIDTACIVREAIIHSDISFEGFDYNRALAYLRVLAGEEIMRKSGLSNLIPKWKGKKVDALRITGDSAKNLENWIFSSHVPTIFEEKLILGLVLEIGVLIAMGSHSYEFAGKFYLQVLGGPIGLALTAWLSSIVMKSFDILWQNLLIKNGVKSLDFLRYVDDVRQFLLGIKKGWRWFDGKFCYDSNWEADDIASGVPDDKRTTNLLLQAMNSVMPFLTFTGECPSDFPDLRLPTLDCNLWESNGKILFSFFQKPMRADKSIDAKTALPASTIKSSLRQEIVRRLTNMHLELDLSEKLCVLDEFYIKLRRSGHEHLDIQILFMEALLKFKNMVSRSKLSPENTNFGPLYLSNDTIG